MTQFRAATAEQAAFLAALIDHGLLVETVLPGVYGQGPDFERARLGFCAALSRAGAADGAEPMRFPPLLPRQQLETNGYLATRTGAGSSR